MFKGVWDFVFDEDCHAMEMEVCGADTNVTRVGFRRHEGRSSQGCSQHGKLQLLVLVLSDITPRQTSHSLSNCCFETICFALSRIPWRKLSVCSLPDVRQQTNIPANTLKPQSKLPPTILSTRTGLSSWMYAIVSPPRPLAPPRLFHRSSSVLPTAMRTSNCMRWNWRMR